MMESNPVRHINVEEAKGVELLEFCRMFNYDLSDVDTGAEDEVLAAVLRELLEGAGWAEDIFLPVERGSFGFKTQADEELNYEWDGSDEGERWCFLRYINDEMAGIKNSPIPVQMHDMKARIPRGIPVCIRERFYRHLNSCKTISRNQARDESGVPVQSLVSATVIRTERFPNEWFGFRGLVKDGLPKLKGNERFGDSLLVVYGQTLSSDEMRQLKRTIGEQRVA